MNNDLIAKSKRLAIFTHDAVMICLAWTLSYFLKYNLSTIPISGITSAEHFLPIVWVVQISCFIWFGLYRGIWQFASMPDLIRILKAVVAGVLISLIVIYLLTGLHGVPRSVFPLYAMLLIGLLSAPRCLYRWWRDRLGYAPPQSKRVLIIGAGGGGDGLIRNLIRSHHLEYHPVAIVDDNPQKQGMELHGIRVVGTTNDIPTVVDDYQVEHIFLAIPTADSTSMRKIVQACEAAQVPFSTLPSLQDLTSGRVSIKELRDVSLNDLLGRDQIALDWDAIRCGVSNQCVVVTGAGGSIGSELTRQIASLAPKKLILIDNCEFNLYNIQSEMLQKFPHIECIIYLDSVCDAVAMRRIFSAHQPQIVFHAAAFKHVPLLEAQIRTAVLNNVFGTKTLAEVASNAGVERFILISTDKAVHPLNVMGTTKRAAELFCQAFDAQSNTQFITVRFGNVLGSAGSVIPLFQKQLQSGGPLTVTHPDMTRYFMTIPEASQLILQASVLGKGSDIFVLDMGEPVLIRYLAEQMIRLSGKKVGKDIDIIYTGLRPGEKLTEELFFQSETLLPTLHEKILKARHIETPMAVLFIYFERLKHVIEQDDDSILMMHLQSLIEAGQSTQQKEKQVVSA